MAAPSPTARIDLQGRCPLWRRPFVSRMINHPLEEADMKYALLIYPKPGSHEELGEDEQESVSAEYWAFREDPRCLGGAHLQPLETATTVRHGGAGDPITHRPSPHTQGGGGGHLVFARGQLEEALEVAERVPAVRLGGAVEVRPLMEIPAETAH